jgi:hypothetical protein
MKLLRRFRAVCPPIPSQTRCSTRCVSRPTSVRPLQALSPLSSALLRVPRNARSWKMWKDYRISRIPTAAFRMTYAFTTSRSAVGVSLRCDFFVTGWGCGCVPSFNVSVHVCADVRGRWRPGRNQATEPSKRQCLPFGGVLYVPTQVEFVRSCTRQHYCTGCVWPSMFALRADNRSFGLCCRSCFESTVTACR